MMGPKNKKAMTLPIHRFRAFMASYLYKLNYLLKTPATGDRPISYRAWNRQFAFS